MTLAELWTGILSHLWQSSLVLLALLALARLLRGAPARYEHALWTIGLVKLLVPLAAGSALVHALLPADSARPLVLDPVWADPGRGLAPALEAPSTEPFLLLLTLVWIAGSAGLLGRLAFEQLGAARLRRNARAPREQELPLLEAARNGTAVPAGALRITSEGIGPAVVGLVRPVILLSEPALALPPDELRVILRHEDAHRRRRDPARTLLRRVAAALLFFYPPLVPLMRRLHETAEFAADEYATRAANPALLARALARIVQLGLLAAPEPAASGNSALLSRRFERLTASWRRPMPIHRIALATAASLVLVASLLPVASAGDKTAAEDVEFDTPPAVTHQVAPEYPAGKDGKREVTGRVLVQLTVDTEGVPTDLVVTQEIEGHPEFSEAATEALAQWRFSPARKDGKAVPATILVPIQFELDGNKAEKTKKTKKSAEAPDESRG